MAEADTHRVLATLQQRRVEFQLSTTDLCFLVALNARAAETSLASFEEDLLVQVFLGVCELTEPGAENPRKRATHALQRLRDQHLLARVDGAGVMRAGEYAMTRLASAVVEFFVADEALTRDSLTILTKTLLSQLSEIKEAAAVAATPDAWRQTVVEPMRVTVSDLVNGIERRQRGLDTQQEEVREQIGTLLQQDWFSAVEHCERLLDDTARTLGELNEVLLRDTSHLQVLLSDVEHLAAEASARDAEEAAQRVSEHVDRVGAWGGARQRTWSEYYQYVQRFLRGVVRLDPKRALSDRLRNQLAGWAEQPFALYVAAAASIRLLRELDLRAELPAVVRPRGERERPLADAATAPVDVEALARQALEGAPALRDVVSAVLPQVPAEERYRAIGRVAAVAASRDPAAGADRRWVPVGDAFEIEDWELGKRRGRR
jgi:chromosome partition protein MukF